METKDAAAKLVVGAITVWIGVTVAKSGTSRLIDGIVGVAGALSEAVKGKN